MIDFTTQFSIGADVAQALEGMETLGRRCFYYHTNLIGDVVLPESITNLDNAEAFYCCTSVTSVTIGANCATINATIFQSMGSNMKALIINRVTPPTLSGVNAFSGSPRCVVYVPDAAVDDYKSANYWDSYASRIKGISELPTT